MNLRWLHVVNGLLLVGLWVFVIALYPALPAEIPQHMGLTGEPTRWTSRESGMWFLVPILTSVHVVIMYGLGSVATTPGGFNVPHKKRIQALPRDAQAFALQPLRVFMFGLATWLVVLGWAVQAMMYRAAIRADVSVLAAGLLVLVIVPLVGAFWLGRAIRRRLAGIDAATGRADGATADA